MSGVMRMLACALWPLPAAPEAPPDPAADGGARGRRCAGTPGAGLPQRRRRLCAQGGQRTARRCNRQAGPGRDLALRIVQAARAAADQDFAEQARDLLGAAIVQTIDFQIDARRIGLVEALDPGGDGLEVFGFAADHADRIEPCYRLEFDHVLAQPALPGGHDLLDLGDDRLRRRVANWKYADRLAAHPIAVEAEHGVDGGTALRSGALDDHEVARVIDAHRVGLDAEAVKQLQHRLRRDIAQRHHADAVARAGGFTGADKARPGRVGGSPYPVAIPL